MPVSPFLTSILEQITEPLLCLHGAGYFSPEEWTQLDLILNKKHTWTISPPTLISIGTKNSINLEQETMPMLTNGIRDISNSETSSLYASGRTVNDISTSPASIVNNWGYSLAMSCPRSQEPKIPDQIRPRSFKHPHERVLIGYSVVQPEETKSSSSSSSRGPSRRPTSWKKTNEKSTHPPTQKSKSTAVKKVEARKSSREESKNNQIVQNTTASPQPRKKTAQSSKQCVPEKVSEHQGDVNMFETSNAAEWDEDKNEQDQVPTTKEDISVLAGDNIEKVEIIKEEEHAKKIAHSFGSAIQLATCDRSRVLDIPRLTYHKESNNHRASTDGETGAQPKSRVCWFWAESPGGCRYRSEECLNLHMKPSFDALFKKSMKESMSTKGSFTIKGPRVSGLQIEPKTCWYWANSGTCEKGDECKNVHGWVLAGIEDCPQGMDSRKILSTITDEKKLVTVDLVEQGNECIIMDLELGNLEINENETALMTLPNLNNETKLIGNHILVPELLS